MDKLYLTLLFSALISIEFLATTTTVHIEVVESMWDKANHFVAFFTLYILLSLAKSAYSLRLKSLLLLGFGLQIEVVQYFIEGREFSLLDLVADSVGLAIGAVSFTIYKRFFS